MSTRGTREMGGILTPAKGDGDEDTCVELAPPYRGVTGQARVAQACVDARRHHQSRRRRRRHSHWLVSFTLAPDWLVSFAATADWLVSFAAAADWPVSADVPVRRRLLLTTQSADVANSLQHIEAAGNLRRGDRAKHLAG